MVIKPEQDRVRTLIIDTVSLLCKNGLNYSKEFSIEGLLGITLDRDDVFLVNIKEIVKMEGCKDDSGSDDSEDGASATPRKRRRRKRKPTNDDSDDDNDDNTSLAQDNNSIEPPSKSIKQELEDSGDDLVFVKDEPSQLSYNNSNLSQQTLQTANFRDNSLGDMSQSFASSEQLPNALSWDPSMFSSSQPPANLNTSMQSAVGQSPGGQQEGENKCQTCGACYSLKSSLKLHIRLKHRGDYPYTCQYCGKGSTNRKHMEKHVEKHQESGIPATLNVHSSRAPTLPLATANLEQNKDFTSTFQGNNS